MLTLLFHCSRDPTVATKTASGLGGVTFSIPSDYEIDERDGELRVYQPSRERRRSPVAIILTSPRDAPAWRGAETRSLAGRDVHFLLSREDGGSGGEAVQLKAWTTVDHRIVMVESVVQPDVGGDAEFKAEWAILSTLQ
ncbi:MAG TPA: Tsi3 family protein [Polyangiales bacterium]